MRIGIIALGRMGSNMVLRLNDAGHDCVAYDLTPASVEQREKDRVTGATSVEDYALIRDCVSAALVAKKRIERLALPPGF